DGSVVLHHVRVGDRQAPIRTPSLLTQTGRSSICAKMARGGESPGVPAKTSSSSYTKPRSPKRSGVSSLWCGNCLGLHMPVLLVDRQVRVPGSDSSVSVRPAPTACPSLE